MLPCDSTSIVNVDQNMVVINQNTYTINQKMKQYFIIIFLPCKIHVVYDYGHT